jgi:PKD repeat protein
MVATTLVTITDTCGSVSITDLVSNSPVTVGATMYFTPTVVGSGPYTYTWDFGGAGTQDGTAANPTYTYDAAGTYTVTLTVENACDTDSRQLVVTVDPEPGPGPITGLQAFNDGPTPLGAVTTLSATVTSGEVLTFTWDFADGSSRALGNPVVHTYAAVGTYTATVTATNAISTVAATTVVRVVPRGVEVAPDNQAWAAAGDTVTYTHRVTNTGQFPDTFTMTVTSSLGWPVSVMPAALALAGGESASVTVLVTVPASPGGDQDVATVTATSDGDPATSDDAVDITWLLVENGARLEPDRAAAIDPGTGIAYTHTLTNTGSAALTFDLAVQQDQAWSINVAPPTVTLDAGASHPVTVTVTAPAGALAGTVNAVYVRATAQEDATVQAYAVDRTTVNQIFGVHLQPDRQMQGMPGQVLTLTHTLSNEGNGEDTFDLAVVSPSGWTVSAAPTPVTLAAGASRTVTVTVMIPTGAAIGTQEQIAVSATSRGDGATIFYVFDDVEVVETPVWEIYLPLIARNYEAPDPNAPNLVITGITVTPANPQAGELVTISVTVANHGLQPVAFGNNFYVDFYVNRQPQPLLAGDLSWGAQGTWFGAGASYTFEGTYTFSQGGDHTLYAQADTDDTVVEGNEYDNVHGPHVVTVAGVVQQQAPDRPVATPAPLQGPRPTPTPQRAP